MPLIIPTSLINFGVAALLFLCGSFALTAAMSPPTDPRAHDPRSDATLYGIALFCVALGIVIGLRP